MGREEEEEDEEEEEEIMFERDQNKLKTFFVCAK